MIKSKKDEKKMQNIIVAIIVALAIWYLARTLFGKKPSQDACGCGCSGCPASAACNGDPGNPAPSQATGKDQSG